MCFILFLHVYDLQLQACSGDRETRENKRDTNGKTSKGKRKVWQREPVEWLRGGGGKYEGDSTHGRNG